MNTRFSAYLSMLHLALPASAETGKSQTHDSPSRVGIPAERMLQVYAEVKTPFKHGVVIRGEANQMLDVLYRRSTSGL